MGHYYIGQAGLKKIFQLIKTKLTEYARNEDLADVATTGAYTDLIGEPTKVSDLPNDAGYLTQHQSLAAYAKTADVTTALGLKADKTEIPTLDEEPTNGSENGVTSGGVYTAIQEAIQEGAGITVDTEMSDTSTNPVQNKAVKAAIDTVERVSSNAYHITSGILTLARGGTGVSSLAALQAEVVPEKTGTFSHESLESKVRDATSTIRQVGKIVFLHASVRYTEAVLTGGGTIDGVAFPQNSIGMACLVYVGSGQSVSCIPGTATIGDEGTIGVGPFTDVTLDPSYTGITGFEVCATWIAD